MSHALARDFRYLLGFVVFCVAIYSLSWLDKTVRQVYTAPHAGSCFIRQIPEPWDPPTVGKVEQVGVNHLLVTWTGAQWLLRENVATELPKAKFRELYTEVVCIKPTPSTLQK